MKFEWVDVSNSLPGMELNLIQKISQKEFIISEIFAEKKTLCIFALPFKTPDQKREGVFVEKVAGCEKEEEEGKKYFFLKAKKYLVDEKRICNFAAPKRKERR